MTGQISIVTSLYRTEQHLPAFIQYALDVAGQVRQAGDYSPEFIIVANEATERERLLLDDFQQRYDQVKVLYVPRESLYASWNRGVQAATGQAIGFWNVDDIRTSAGLIEGYNQIVNGCQLVYFSHTVIRTASGRQRERRQTYPAAPFDPELHRRVMKCGPFFMFAPELYQRVGGGGFDERFRIVGDWEWCIRALNHTEFCPRDLIAGYFLLHGGNLSDSGNPLQLAEENIIYLLNRASDRLIPIDPELMHKTWSKWAESLPLTPELEARLWGEGAKQRAEDWLRHKKQMQRRTRLQNVIRYLPKKVIDQTGLRPYLAKLGLVKNRPSKTGKAEQ
ncbi:MAG TPA: glycosyltransferase [Phototrophicaceae bacterium]|jgi:glycosyltransferase involved in cell wall biosynthesis|nr:glycosyltransferase [Phototrophicaceae bacterium]